MSQNHKTQAKHNEKLLCGSCFPDPCNSLNNVNYKDWNITIVFYEALHYVQSYLWKNRAVYGYRTFFKNHTDRNNYLADLSKTDQRVAAILSDYVGLFKASCVSRYDPRSYATFQQKEICDYKIFAMKTLPKTLGLT